MQIAAALIGLFSRLRARAQGMATATFIANQSVLQGQGVLTRFFASLKEAVAQIATALVELVSRVPARVHSKLLVAFLAIAVLLIMMGAVALNVLSGMNERTQKLIKLQRKIEAYRQVQHDTTSQLYNVSSALVSSDERTLLNTLRQLNQFGYDVARLEFVASDETELLTQVHRKR